MQDTTATETKALTSLTIIVREWFDKTYGNTYHSAKVVANGKTVAVIPMTYGHGDLTYLVEAVAILTADGYELPAFVPSSWVKGPGFSEFREAGVPVVIDVTDVARKKDLHK